MSALARLSPHQKRTFNINNVSSLSCFRELTLDMPKMSCWNLARGYPKVVTQITVHSAEGLEKKYANESKISKGVWENKI